MPESYLITGKGVREEGSKTIRCKLEVELVKPPDPPTPPADDYDSIDDASCVGRSGGVCSFSENYLAYRQGPTNGQHWFARHLDTGNVVDLGFAGTNHEIMWSGHTYHGPDAYFWIEKGRLQTSRVRGKGIQAIESVALPETEEIVWYPGPNSRAPWPYLEGWKPATNQRSEIWFAKNGPRYSLPPELGGLHTTWYQGGGDFFFDPTGDISRMYRVKIPDGEPELIEEHASGHYVSHGVMYDALFAFGNQLTANVEIRRVFPGSIHAWPLLHSITTEQLSAAMGAPKAVALHLHLVEDKLIISVMTSPPGSKYIGGAVLYDLQTKTLARLIGDIANYPDGNREGAPSLSYVRADGSQFWAYQQLLQGTTNIHFGKVP